MTNERLKEILQMVLENRDSDYLCIRLRSIPDVNHIEYDLVREYMFARRPDKSREVYWWGRNLM